MSPKHRSTPFRVHRLHGRWTQRLVVAAAPTFLLLLLFTVAQASSAPARASAPVARADAAILASTTPTDILTAGQIDLVGPPGSGGFGKHVTLLANGNFVVADPLYDEGATADVGAVYLYDGATLAVISMLKGSTAGDQVGSGGVEVLQCDAFVVLSPKWDNDTLIDAGAATWADAFTGVNGVVDAGNSLVGEGTGRAAGSVLNELTNGNYLVRGLGNPAPATFSRCDTPTRGTVSLANSHFIQRADAAFYPLKNGNYVYMSLGSFSWGNGATGTYGGYPGTSMTGATGRLYELPNGNFVVITGSSWATWVDGSKGLTGTVSVSNSLSLGAALDYYFPLTTLANGNYVLSIPDWNGKRGAVAWAPGDRPITGTVSSTNSLVGNTPEDYVGYSEGGTNTGIYPSRGVSALPNGDYVVISRRWHNGAAEHAGAVTWGNGETGIRGFISAANSLVGTNVYDFVGGGGVHALKNGGMVVLSPSFEYYAMQALTWGSGDEPLVGVVSAANSMMNLGPANWGIDYFTITPLENGANLIRYNCLRCPVHDVLTWVGSADHPVGTVSESNSIVRRNSSGMIPFLQTTSGEILVLDPDTGKTIRTDGSGPITNALPGVLGATWGSTLLANGAYLTPNAAWNGNRGAVTWIDGSGFTTATIDALSSLVGSTVGDEVGKEMIALKDGSYLAVARSWDAGALVDAGALTWIDPSGGTRGVVSAQNSLVGGSTADTLGNASITPLANGNYVVTRPLWEEGTTLNIGGVTFGTAASHGALGKANTLTGITASDSLGSGGITALPNGHYAVVSPYVDNGAIVDAGAVSFGHGTVGTDGPISPVNTVLGAVAGAGSTLVARFNPVYEYLLVSRPSEQLITVFAAPFALQVTRAGNGAGIVTSDAGGIVCGDECSRLYRAASSLTLTATAQTGSTFTGWQGACAGTSTCVLDMDADKTATATFALNPYALMVTRSGNGAGVVRSTPAGIDCGGDCAEEFLHGTAVALTAEPAQGSTFAGWQGACSGAGVCNTTIDGVQAVTATFTLNSYPVTVKRTGDGWGFLTIRPEYTICGDECSASFLFGTAVTVTAIANPDSVFDGWSGAGCNGTAPCALIVDQAKSITGAFSLKRFDVTVHRQGGGTGTVVSTPPGIDCGADCTETFAYGANLLLQAIAANGSTFAGWTTPGWTFPTCAGTVDCTFTVSGGTPVSATFTLNSYLLSTAVTGAGGGVIRSTPAGIDCGAECSHAFPFGTVVTLTPEADATSDFAGWSGACAGTGACAVTIDAAKSVAATFAHKTYALVVKKAGTGDGVVTSAPAGIECGATCAHLYDLGMVVALTATPATDSSFAGWSGGGCGGTAACVVTVASATEVTATFTRDRHPVAVVLAGEGTGTVTSTPAGILCGDDCSELVDHGAVMTLAASPGVDATFAGWSGGGCSGTSDCVVTVSAPATVTATFARLEGVPAVDNTMYYGRDLREIAATAGAAGALYKLIVFAGVDTSGIVLAGVEGSEPYTGLASFTALTNALLVRGCADAQPCNTVHRVRHESGGKTIEDTITVPVISDVFIPLVSR